MPLHLLAILLLFGLVAAASQILLKAGVSEITAASPGFRPLLLLLAFFTNFKLLAATALYVLAYVIYMALIARHPVSEAYPLAVGMSFVLISLAAWLLLGESLTGARAAGLALIILGMYVVVRG
jgi:multidrug transporter EmrE-like cation transporter